MSDSPLPSAPESALSESALPAWIDELADRARSVDGQPPFSDQAIVDARRGERRVLAIGEDAAALLATPADGAAEAEFVVDPDARRHGHGTALVQTLIEQANGDLLIWAHGDHPAARALAARFGFDPVRTLLQLRAEVDPSTGSGSGGRAEVDPSTSSGSGGRPVEGVSPSARASTTPTGLPSTREPLLATPSRAASRSPTSPTSPVSPGSTPTISCWSGVTAP